MKKLVLILTIIIPSLAFSQPKDYHLAINEVYFSKNAKWIELYNYGDIDIDLTRAYLSNTDTLPLKWKVENTSLIKAKSYQVIYLNKKEGIPYIEQNVIEGNELYLYFSTSQKPQFIDYVNLKNKPSNTQLCRIPDAHGIIKRSSKKTPQAPNHKRTFLDVKISPMYGIGISGASFRQTESEYSTKKGLYSTYGGSIDLFLWERYQASIGLNYGTFNYSFTSFSRVQKENYYYFNDVIGTQSSKWADVKLPLLYHSIRVHDHTFVDIGFLVSVRTKRNLEYEQSINYFSNDDNSPIGNPITIQYNSDEVDGGDVAARMPLVIGISHQFHKNIRGFVTYYVRKDRNNLGLPDVKRNLKYAVYGGVCFNLHILKL